MSELREGLQACEDAGSLYAYGDWLVGELEKSQHENDQLLNLLDWCFDVIEREVLPPKSCGACGTPNARCDGNCADAVYYARMMREIHEALTKRAAR